MVIAGRMAVALALGLSAAIAFYRTLPMSKCTRNAIIILAWLVIGVTPWLIPLRYPLARALIALFSIAITVKLYDVHRFVSRGGRIGFREYLLYLGNELWLVRARFPTETRLSKKDNLRLLCQRMIGLLFGLIFCTTIFRMEWPGYPFWAEHAAKAIAVYVTLVFTTNAAAAVWRLAGIPALDPFSSTARARTPAEFWRRWNRPAAQFFNEYVFLPAGGYRAPIRATLLTFLVSATLHEYLLTVILGAPQGFQLAFFLLNGLAALLTLRLRPTGRRAAIAVIFTFAFEITTSVLFFASINHVVPFYSRPLPGWLGNWDRDTYKFGGIGPLPGAKTLAMLPVTLHLISYTNTSPPARSISHPSPCKP